MFKMNGSRVAALVAAALIAALAMVGLTSAGIGVGGMMAIIGPIQLILYVVFWATVIAGGIWLAREMGLFKAMDGSSNDDATAEVRRRYAKGEISRTEYFQLLEDLEAESNDRQRI